MWSYYGVTARIADNEIEIYDGQDPEEAQALAIGAYVQYGGGANVTILLDGGTWRDVKHVPGDLSTAQLCEPSCCLHPQCGQINPLSCYCAAAMTEEEKERYRSEYA